MAEEMKLITDITLELTGETKRYEVVAKQGDKATRFVRIKLKNNGQDFEIPAGMKVIANIQKPDRKCCYNTCSYSGNTVTMGLTNQALAVAGTAECDIEIRDANDEVVLSSQAFTIEIEKSMRDENAIRSSNEFTQLEKDVREYAAEYLEKNPVQPTPIDKTLTQENEAADAKKTGEEFEKRLIKPDVNGEKGQALFCDENGNAVWEEAVKNGEISEKKLDDFLQSKFIQQSSLLRNVEYASLKNADVADVTGIGGNTVARIGTTTLIPVTGTIYVKVFTTATFGGSTAQALWMDWYNENKNILKTVQCDKYISGKLSISDTNVIYRYKIPLDSNVSYVRLRHPANQTTLEVSAKNIMSYSNIPMDEEITNENYKYIYSDDLKRYINDSINSYYRFSQVGRLMEQPEYDYTCWSHDMLHYDSDNDRFVQTMKSNGQHGGTDGCLYISYIDSKTLKATKPAEIQLRDGINHVTWGQGFWINASGQYVIIGTIGTERDTSAKYHRIVSSDHGTTWTDMGEIIFPEGYESYYFHSCHLLSSGRVLGVFDDGSIAAGTSTKTEIAYSDDDGLNWEIVSILADVSSVEQHFVEIDDTVMMIGRKNNYNAGPNAAVISFSQDDGETWTKARNSGSLVMHCSNAVSFVHDDMVEVFTLSRYYTKQGKKNGVIRHYIAAKEDALSDYFSLVECFYGTGNVAADFHAPGLAMDSEGNVLVSYSDSVASSSTPTELYFLYGTMAAGREIVCDGRASEILPYSGAKIEKMFEQLRSELLGEMG